MLDQKLFILFLMVFVISVNYTDGAKKALVPNTSKTSIGITKIPKLKKLPNQHPDTISIESGTQSTSSIEISRSNDQTPIIATKLPKAKQPTYRAAVVELNPVAKGDTVDGVFEVTMQIVKIMESKDLKGVDIVVLPEGIFNKQNTAVVLPSDTNSYYENPRTDPVLQTLSMVARNSKKYIVINLYVKEMVNSSTHLYNMVIVFDRKGNAIAKYRKYHLFGEYGVERPKVPDLTTFTTDFGVTFGIAICFDLMFADPMETLIRHGVKNFVYPTYWFSGLPYLSSAQYQQSWAYANNVNLLAANTNAPNIGCSGSGIYSGRSGALEVFVSLTPATKVLIADVPSDVSTGINLLGKKGKSVKQRTHPMNTQDVANIGQEDFSKYSMKFLDFSENSIQTGKVCVDDFCCHYSIEVNDLGELKGKSSYSYAISVFHDLRRFKGRKNPKTGLDVCSLIACTDMNSKDSCGKVIGDLHNRYNFKKLHLDTTLPKTHMKIMPSTLTTELQPFQTNEFQFKVSKMSGGKNYEASLSLYSPKNDLFTFAIYSRDYDRDTM
ncbi:vanin-like protein 2 [Contarinia nasturtii]|uniref:vanin-like protein 2 n=1 Tax=Contarinia nasturtii TaxID=265458 RepID=UPI0012D3F7F9|nr:vanin-like protein 2 [Contarinia nasturtii]